jgi:hypothetical protein
MSDEHFEILTRVCIYSVTSDVYTDLQSVDCEMCNDDGVWIASSFVLKNFLSHVITEGYFYSVTVLLCISRRCLFLHIFVTILINCLCLKVCSIRTVRIFCKPFPICLQA